MKIIDKVTVCNREFDIIQRSEDLVGGYHRVTFAVDLDGKERTLGISYTTEMVEALNRTHGLNAEDELVDIAVQEIRFELFSTIHNVSLIDVTMGKRPDLLREFVSEFGVGYIDSEVQEKHFDVIAEVLI